MLTTLIYTLWGLQVVAKVAVGFRLLRSEWRGIAAWCFTTAALSAYSAAQLLIGGQAAYFAAFRALQPYWIVGNAALVAYIGYRLASRFPRRWQFFPLMALYGFIGLALALWMGGWWKPTDEARAALLMAKQNWNTATFVTCCLLFGLYDAPASPNAARARRGLLWLTGGEFAGVAMAGHGINVVAQVVNCLAPFAAAWWGLIRKGDDEEPPLEVNNPEGRLKRLAAIAGG